MCRKLNVPQVTFDELFRGKPRTVLDEEGDALEIAERRGMEASDEALPWRLENNKRLLVVVHRYSLADPGRPLIHLLNKVGGNPLVISAQFPAPNLQRFRPDVGEETPMLMLFEEGALVDTWIGEDCEWWLEHHGLK